MVRSEGLEQLDRLWRRGRAFLGVRYAIMGGAMTWVSERHLVAAISNGGGFGVIASGAMSPDLLAAEIAATAALTDRPFGVNLFVAPQPETIEPSAQRAALAAVAGYYMELGLPAPAPVPAPYAPNLEEQLAAVAEIRPRVFTVHLGALAAVEVKKLKALGILLG